MINKTFKTEEEKNKFLNENYFRVLKIEKLSIEYEILKLDEETLKQIAIVKKKESEEKVVKKLGGDSQVNAVAKFLNIFATEFAEKYPESKTAGLMKIVNETLNK